MAAIEALDAAVVEAGGEVITLADRQAAITELDAAVEATANTFPRLSKAIAEAQRLKAWDADEGFTAALAAGTVQVEIDAKGWSDGPFVAWVQHRYQWKATYARQMSRAGHVLDVIEASGPSAIALVEPPSNENQVRKLAKLLKAPDADEVIPQVWEQAVREAEADRKPQSVARYVDRIIKAEFPELTMRSVEDIDADLDRELRQFRKLFRSLHGRMNHADFADRVIGWQNQELESDAD
jgi:hypothetical protein